MTRYITPFFISFHTSRKDLVLRTTLFLNQIITPNNKPFNQPNTSPTGMNCPKVTPAHTRSICLQCDCWLVATLKLGPPYTFELPSVEAMFLARTNWHDHLLRYLPPGKDKVPMLMDSNGFCPSLPTWLPFSVAVLANIYPPSLSTLSSSFLAQRCTDTEWRITLCPQIISIEQAPPCRKIPHREPLRNLQQIFEERTFPFDNGCDSNTARRE